MKARLLHILAAPCVALKAGIVRAARALDRLTLQNALKLFLLGVLALLFLFWWSYSRKGRYEFRSFGYLMRCDNTTGTVFMIYPDHEIQFGIPPPPTPRKKETKQENETVSLPTATPTPATSAEPAAPSAAPLAFVDDRRNVIRVSPAKREAFLEAARAQGRTVRQVALFADDRGNEIPVAPEKREAFLEGARAQGRTVRELTAPIPAKH